MFIGFQCPDNPRHHKDQRLRIRGFGIENRIGNSDNHKVFAEPAANIKLGNFSLRRIKRNLGKDLVILFQRGLGQNRKVGVYRFPAAAFSDVKT